MKKYKNLLPMMGMVFLFITGACEKEASENATDQIQEDANLQEVVYKGKSYFSAKENPMSDDAALMSVLPTETFLLEDDVDNKIFVFDSDTELAAHINGIKTITKASECESGSFVIEFHDQESDRRPLKAWRSSDVLKRRKLSNLINNKTDKVVVNNLECGDKFTLIVYDRAGFNNSVSGCAVEGGDVFNCVPDCDGCSGGIVTVPAGRQLSIDLNDGSNPFNNKGKRYGFTKRIKTNRISSFIAFYEGQNPKF